MRARPLAQLRLLLGGLAASGVLMAHLVAYLLVEQHPQHPGGLASAPSHRVWSLIAAGAMGLTVAGLVRLAFDRTCSRRTPAPSRRSLVGPAALRLIPLQVLGCLSLQVIERWVVGESSAAELTAQAMLIGAGLQILVAFVGAFVLVLFVSAVELFLARWVPPTLCGPAVQPRAATHYLPPRFQVGSGSGTVRGPPLFV
jgi:hypothetical protein